ncbi:MAG: EAL domain-containing protein [Leptospira sp.]|nr:EAL domain-containing protein [Leptospira sp.]
MESNRFIVCIDDEFFILWNLKEQLKKVFGSQFSIETADSAESAVEIIQEIKESGGDLAVVICDQVMPGKNGDEFLIELHKDNPKTKKIILTGQAPAQAIGNALNHGCLYRFLPKPWDSHDLELTIKQAIDAFYQEKTLEEKNAKLERSLFFNPKTDCANLESLHRKLNQELEKSHTLELLQMPNYYTLIQNFGKDFTDTIVKKFVQTLSESLCPSDTLYHTSENEFVVLTEWNEEETRMTTESFLIPLTSKDLIVGGLNIRLNFDYSISHGTTDLYYKAKLALSPSEEKNSDFLIPYTENTHTSLPIQNIQRAKSIKDALSEDRIVPYFQGIFNNQTKEFCMFECLVRLKENEILLPPNDFLNLVNLTGNIRQIDQEMIQKSMQYFSKTPYEFSLNISDLFLKEEGFFKWIQEKMTSYEVPSNQICLEIPESTILSDYHKIKPLIGELKSLGCRISIDRFGDRYSEIKRLLEINPDYIKIDKKFMAGITHHNSNRILLKGLVEIATDVGIKLIATYVDKQEIQSFVEDLGIEYSQGFLFMEPSSSIPKN